MSMHIMAVKPYKAIKEFDCPCCGLTDKPEFQAADQSTITMPDGDVIVYPEHLQVACPRCKYTITMQHKRVEDGDE